MLHFGVVGCVFMGVMDGSLDVVLVREVRDMRVCRPKLWRAGGEGMGRER